MNNSRLMMAALIIGLLCIFCSMGQSLEKQFVEITKPKSGDNVTWRFTVEGNSSATANSGFKIYVLIWPMEANGSWWVQQTQTFPDGTWESDAYFGRDPKVYPIDIGTTYKVEAIMTKDALSANETFRELPNLSKSYRSESIIVKRK